jgi:hypothetical protein
MNARSSPDAALLRFVAVGLLLLVVSPVLAQSGGMYDLTWSTVDGGGTLSAGEGYSVAGTIGQSEAGLISGGGFTVGGGFLPGGEIAPEYRIYLPLVLRSYP